MRDRDQHFIGGHRGHRITPADAGYTLPTEPQAEVELQFVDYEDRQDTMQGRQGFTLVPTDAGSMDDPEGFPRGDGGDGRKGGIGIRGGGDVAAGSAAGTELEHRSSDLRTFLNLFIAFIGAGILGIPYAFRQGGLFLSTLVICVVGALCAYCMWLLIRCRYRVLAIRDKRKTGPVTYADVCHEALGKVGLVMVESALVASQSAFATAYLVFIARNLTALFDLSKGRIVLFCLPGLVMMCLIRHLKYLAPFSLLAEVVNLTGLAVVFFDDAEFMLLGDKSVALARWEALPFVFGVGVYCFEGMGMVLPIEDAMINRERFTPILSMVMVIYTALCVLSGVLGYLAFGDDTKDIILLNIGSTLSALVVKLSFCVGLYFTFPIMMVPVWEVLEFKWLRHQSPSYERSRNLIRTGVVLATGLLACIVPNFGLFVSLIGSSCCALLAFILPTLCYSRLEKNAGYPLGLWRSLLNNAILVSGVFAMVSGTMDTLRSIVMEVTQGSVAGGER